MQVSMGSAASQRDGYLTASGEEFHGYAVLRSKVWPVGHFRFKVKHHIAAPAVHFECPSFPTVCRSARARVYTRIRSPPTSFTAVKERPRTLSVSIRREV
mmetsp:Transcript_113753/g.157446  ORF Transcript_113753/g.157446 Transcript_113753/m.157446 type:complete len:100 (+) Transcript_113753:371-670(+)